MPAVGDLIELMLDTYARTEEYPDFHRIFRSGDIKLETWCMRGGLTPPCEIFEISILKDGVLVEGMIIYLRISDTLEFRIDAMRFNKQSIPIFDATIRPYNQPKKYLSIYDSEHNYTSINLDSYAEFKIDGGWDHIMSQLMQFLK